MFINDPFRRTCGAAREEDPDHIFRPHLLRSERAHILGPDIGRSLSTPEPSPADRYIDPDLFKSVRGQEPENMGHGDPYEHLRFHAAEGGDQFLPSHPWVYEDQYGPDPDQGERQREELNGGSDHEYGPCTFPNTCLVQSPCIPVGLFLELSKGDAPVKGLTATIPTVLVDHRCLFRYCPGMNGQYLGEVPCPEPFFEAFFHIDHFLNRSHEGTQV